MEKLPDNSGQNLSVKPQTEKRAPVAKGVKRQSIGGMFKDAFRPEDLSVEMILQSYVIPILKDGLFDTAIGILDYMRGGSSTGYSRFRDRGRRDSRDRGRRDNYHAYDKPSRMSERYSENEYPGEPRGAERLNYDEIMIPDVDPETGIKDSHRARTKAISILTELEDDIRAYSVARLDHFYDMCEVTSYHTDYNYGWTNLSNAKVVRVPGGWAFDLPKPMAVDD